MIENSYALILFKELPFRIHFIKNLKWAMTKNEKIVKLGIIYLVGVNTKLTMLRKKLTRNI